MGKKYEIIKEGSHGFSIGTIVTIKTDDGSYQPLMEGWWDGANRIDTFWVRYDEVRKLTFMSSLYRAIVGALFGPESHSVNRYKQ